MQVVTEVGARVVGCLPDMEQVHALVASEMYMVNHVGSRDFPIPGIQMNVSPAVKAAASECTSHLGLSQRSR